MKRYSQLTRASWIIFRGGILAGLFWLAVGGSQAAPGDELGTPQHTWAPGHASNPGSTLQMKWGLPGGTYDGMPVTICDSTWTSINGAQGYISYACHAHPQFFCISGPSGEDIAPTAAEFAASGGYLPGSTGGRLLEGHVACPPPPECGNGIVEGGTPMFSAEECDDGNTVDGDGCSSTCQIEGKLASLQHIWAAGHATNLEGPTLLLKFGCNGLPPADKCDQYGSARPLTICGIAWPGLVGQLVYLEQTAGEWFYAWADPDFLIPIGNPPGAATAVPPTEAGRLSGPPAGYFLEGDVMCLEEVLLPMQLKLEALAVLAPCLDDGDKKLVSRIEKAIEHINKSRVESLWVDETTLVEKGKKVFDEEGKAVHELMKILDMKDVDAEKQGVVMGAIEMLLLADRMLAETALQQAVDAACAAGCYADAACFSEDPDPDCDKILAEIDKADADLADAEDTHGEGEFDKAIHDLKKAWEHAQKALGRAE